MWTSRTYSVDIPLRATWPICDALSTILFKGEHGTVFDVTGGYETYHWSQIDRNFARPQWKVRIYPSCHYFCIDLHSRWCSFHYFSDNGYLSREVRPEITSYRRSEPNCNIILSISEQFCLINRMCHIKSVFERLIWSGVPVPRQIWLWIDTNLYPSCTSPTVPKLRQKILWSVL